MTVDQLPDSAPPAGATDPRPGTSRAGRNLPVAIGVGVLLGVVVLVSLYTVKVVFVGVVAVAVGAGLWELVRALNVKQLYPPFLPLAAGLGAVLALAYVRGADGMVVAALLTAVAVVIWRLAEGASGILADIAAALFALTYVVLLAGFAVLLLVPANGPDREVAFIATVVCSDVGGYATGVVAGRHLLAPGISPKKTWEGLVGSVLLCAGFAAAYFHFMFNRPAWHGVLFGLAVVCAATLGDLGESVLKRDIGIKDMGRLLPGHGGLMDRLDSLLVSAPVAWLLMGPLLQRHW
jgi:phosphatidate cytidylyltransferase